MALLFVAATKHLLTLSFIQVKNHTMAACNDVTCAQYIFRLSCSFKNCESVIYFSCVHSELYAAVKFTPLLTQMLNSFLLPYFRCAYKSVFSIFDLVSMVL